MSTLTNILTSTLTITKIYSNNLKNDITNTL